MADREQFLVEFERREKAVRDMRLVRQDLEQQLYRQMLELDVALVLAAFTVGGVGGVEHA